jgi:hypothetical protein
MNHKILVGTFHETGTELMGRILRQISSSLNLRFWNAGGKGAEEPEDWEIGFHSRSRFPDDLLQRHAHRGVLVIRDPRDVVVSAMRSHGTAGDGWLHVPKEKFRGMTYQQRLNSFKQPQRRLLFEMNNASGRTIQGMVAAKARYPTFAVFQFEDLTADRELVHFRAMFDHLGLPAERLDDMLRIVEKSLRRLGKVEPPAPVPSGRPQRWKEEFTPKALETFIQKFSDAPERLGYETSSLEALLGARPLTAPTVAPA